MSFGEIANGFLTNLKDLGDGLTGKTEKDLQNRQMSMQEEYLDFLKLENTMVNQDKTKWIFMILVFIVVVVILLFFLHRKYKIFTV